MQELDDCSGRCLASLFWIVIAMCLLYIAAVVYWEMKP